jgi:carotenoid cleavage dioxygenase-like enzyme
MFLFSVSRSGYMSGNWVPVSTELNNVELTELEGSGVPPALVGGAFYRIGTNLRCWPPSNAHHAFNGDAMIHK